MNWRCMLGLHDFVVTGRKDFSATRAGGRPRLKIDLECKRCWTYESQYADQRPDGSWDVFSNTSVGD